MNVLLAVALLALPARAQEVRSLSAEAGNYRVNGAPAAMLGFGTYKDVLVHPQDPDYVVKVFRSNMADPAAEQALERAALARLAPIGAAPALAARGEGYLVQERVHGLNLERPTPAKLEETAKLFEKLKQAKVELADTTLSKVRQNIMVGETKSGGFRAWLVDPDVERSPKTSAELDAFYDGILNQLRGDAPMPAVKAAPQAPAAAPAPKSEAERLDRQFDQPALWAKIAPAARAEIMALRQRKLSKKQLKDYVAAQAAEAFERIKKARGVSNIGFHYNLHGGRREDYVGAGIRASKGDIALRYSMNADASDKVYFFQTAQHHPYVPLDAQNGEILWWPSRMGYALSLFDLDHPALAAARADGRITNHGAISMDFHKGMRGVPYAAYLAPPLEVFVKTAKKISVKSLSRDEETLATVRFLEAALLSGGAYVPR